MIDGSHPILNAVFEVHFNYEPNLNIVTSIDQESYNFKDL